VVDLPEAFDHGLNNLADSLTSGQKIRIGEEKSFKILKGRYQVRRKVAAGECRLKFFTCGKALLLQKVRNLKKGETLRDGDLMIVDKTTNDLVGDLRNRQPPLKSILSGLKVV